MIYVIFVVVEWNLLLFDSRNEPLLVILYLVHDHNEPVCFSVGCLLMSELVFVSLEAVTQDRVAGTDLWVTVELYQSRSAEIADVFQSKLVISTVPSLFLHGIQCWPYCRL